MYGSDFYQWLASTLIEMRNTDFIDLIKDLSIFSSVLVVFHIIEKAFHYVGARLRSEKCHAFLESPFVQLFPIFRALILYVTCKKIELAPWLDHPVSIALSGLILFRSCRLLVSLIFSLVATVLSKKYKDIDEDVLYPIGIMLKVVIWSLGLVLALDNIGFNVSTIITGLGVGGLAIAIASQKLLGDIFNFFVLALDVPFQVGDHITVADKSGRVEYIGIKTTRIRSVSGELLVMTNSDLTSSCLGNFRKMTKRRSALDFIVSPETQIEKLSELQNLCKRVIEKEERVQIDRIVLTNCSGPGWRLEVIFFILSKDYGVFVQTNHRLIIELLTMFKENEIYLRFT